MEQPTRVTVNRAQARIDREADLARARQLARLLDSRFELAGFRFGFDSLIGLVPGVGDLLTGVLALYPLMLARRHGVSRLVQARMLSNIGLDLLVGAVPVAGDLFDVAFKANLKNLALLEKALADAAAREAG